MQAHRTALAEIATFAARPSPLLALAVLDFAKICRISRLFSCHFQITLLILSVAFLTLNNDDRIPSCS